LGTAGNAVLIAGGSMTVSSGGAANFMTISGGHELVASGGTIGNTTIWAGTLEIASGGHAAGAQVAFSGTTGELVLDENRFKGTIAGFNASDTVDLKAMSWAQNPQVVSYVNNTLTVSAGTDTARLQFLSVQAQANFQLADDGHGGTLIQFHS
jgi:autotransporter passenger strand-loop-strand repeat protein